MAHELWALPGMSAKDEQKERGARVYLLLFRSYYLLAH